MAIDTDNIKAANVIVKLAVSRQKDGCRINEFLLFAPIDGHGGLDKARMGAVSNLNKNKDRCVEHN